MKKSRKLTDFGRAVKIRMLDTGITQAALAEKIGTFSPVISAILYGDRPGKCWIKPICEVLGMDAKPYTQRKSA